MPKSTGRYLTVLRVPVALALVAAYLVAAPGSVNPLAPEEAAAVVDPCTGYDSNRTLSVRADGGRYFVLACQGVSNVSASCGTVTLVPYLYKYESGSCLGPATLSWQVNGTPHSQGMNVEPNGNEPPDCNPPEPGTHLFGAGIEADVSIRCMDWDFDGSGWDGLRWSSTDPAHGSVTQVPGPGPLFFKYSIDFSETLLGMRCDDSFAITLGDDYDPNPKSLPPINFFVDNRAQRPPGICPGLSAEATGQRAAALTKCKKKAKKKDWSKKRLKKCKKKARLLPV